MLSVYPIGGENLRENFLQVKFLYFFLRGGSSFDFAVRVHHPEQGVFAVLVVACKNAFADLNQKAACVIVSVVWRESASL
jgi:hypothetical protein